MNDSMIPPKKSNGSRGFLVAAVVMLLLAGGLLLYKSLGSAEPAPSPSPPVAATAATKPPTAPAPPPPPPPPEEPQADEQGSQAEDAPAPTARSTRPTGCGSPCKGAHTPAIVNELSGRGRQARGCYERALRNNSMLRGKLGVLVRIGPRGQVCSASAVSDSVGDPNVSSCVLQLFRASPFSAPKGGCVDVQVPLNFVPGN